MNIVALISASKALHAVTMLALLYMLPFAVVQAQNLAPELINGGPLLAQRGTTSVIAPTALLAQDPDSLAVIRYRIVSLPNVGTLFLDGVAIGPSGEFNQDDIDGDRLSYSAPSQPGTLDDAFEFIADDGAGGVLGSLGAPIRFPIKLANQAPIATAANLTTDEDQTLHENLAASDADGDALSCELTSPPRKGQLELGGESQCQISFTPNADATGIDLFYFRARDVYGAVSSITPVGITISAINDSPTALPTSLNVKLNTAQDGTLLAADADGDELRFTIETAPNLGSVEIINASSGRFRFTPHKGTSGRDSFSFSVREAQIENSMPSTATVAVNIASSPNRAPIAEPGFVAALEDESYRGRLRATDPDGDPLTFELDLTRVATKGAVQILDETTGAFTYVPDLNAFGPDAFYFRVADGSVLSKPVRVNVDIRAVNDAPQITGVPPLVLESGQALDFQPLISDADGDPLLITISNCPDWATCDTDSGQISGQPAADGSHAGAGAPILIKAFDGKSTASLGPFSIDVLGVVPITRTTPAAGVFNTPQFVQLSCQLPAAAGACDSFYSTDPDADVADFVAYANEHITIAGNTTLRYFSQSAGGTEPVQSADFTIDQTPPELAIVEPLAARLDLFPNISGTASDAESAVQVVALRITDGTHFVTASENGPQITPVPSSIDVPVQAGGIWQLALPQRDWPTGQWSVSATLTDSAGNQVRRLVRFDYVEESASAFTQLSLASSSPTVLPGGELTLSGQLVRLPESGVSMVDLALDVQLIGADDTSLLSTTTRTVDDSGRFELKLDGLLTLPGRHEIQVDFEGTEKLDPSSASIAVLVGASAGYAIIVHGRSADGEGLLSHNLTTNRVYATLKSRGFEDENIRYLSHDSSNAGFDGTSSSTLLMESITQWAQQRMNGAPAPLFIVFVGHAGPARLLIDGADEVDPEQLRQWLEALESGLSSEALTAPRVMVLGGCYTESFFDDLSAPGRILIASAGSDEESYRGPLEDFDDATGEAIRSGELFVELLFKQLALNQSLPQAYEQARSLVEAFTQRGAVANATRYFDNAVQHPFFDDNGDRDGTNRISNNNGDGVASAEVHLGLAVDANADSAAVGENLQARFVQVTPTLRLGEGRDTAKLFAEAKDASRVAAAWAEIRAPSVVLQGQGGTIQLENELTKVLLLPQGQRFEAQCTITETGTRQRGCFSKPGRYEVFYFARDTLTDSVSPLQRSVVYVDRPGNRAPSEFALLFPAADSTLATSIVLDWADAVDPDSDDSDSIAYSVEVARDAEFSNLLLRRNDLRSSTLALGRSDGLVPGETYHWRVTALDRYGATRRSAQSARFTVSADDGLGIVRGVVYARSNARPVANAQITVGGQSINAGADGRFLLALPPGPLELLVEALGFDPAIVSASDVVTGAEQALAVPLDGNALSVVSLALTTDEDRDLSDQLQGATSDGAALTFEVVSPPQHGSFVGEVQATTGNFTYRPDADYNGADKFQFKVRDSSGRESSIGTVNITINPINDAPQLQLTSAVPSLPRVTLGAPSPAGIAVSALLGGQASDPDSGDPRGIAITSHDNALGAWQYSLDGGVQWSPIAYSSPLSATLLDAAPATRVRFLPFASGIAEIEFRAWDQSSGAVAQSGIDTRNNGNDSAFSETVGRATVTVDALGSFPTAQASSFTVVAGSVHHGAMRASGTAGDVNRRFHIVSAPRKGRLRLLNALTGQFRYIPRPGRAGSDSFAFALVGKQWRSNIAPVSVEIVPVNAAPSVENGAFSTPFDRALKIQIRARDNNDDPLIYTINPIPSLICGTLDSAPAGARTQAPILTYTPNVAGACVENPVQVIVDDGALSANATLTITVTDLPNQIPMANAASFTTNEDQMFRNALSGNDPEGEPLSFEIFSAASKGHVTLLHPVTGRFSYTPNRDATGQDSFSFRVRDAEDASLAATVTIDITPVDDAPRISGIPASTVAAGEPYSFTPDAIDPDGELLVFSFANCPQWATCDANTGTISGVPNNQQVGVSRSVRIEVTDGTSVSTLPGFDIAVLPDSGAPEIVRSVVDGAYSDAQHIELTCHDTAGGSCEVFYTLDAPATPPVFAEGSALRAGAGRQIRGEVVGASTGVSTSASHTLTHVVGQAGAVGTANSRHYRAFAGAVSADSDGDGIQDIHDLFPTDPSAYRRYTDPVQVDESATLRSFSRDEAGNISPVTNAIYIIDDQAPEITISAPGSAAVAERILWIGGTVADAGTGVAELAVEIKDEHQYLTPSGTSATPIQLPVSVTDGGAWLLFTGTVPWELETVYSITARARDAAGNESAVSRLVQLSDDPVQRPTRLALELSARRVLVDDRIAVAGKLTRLPDSGLSLAGREIEISVLEPDGSLLFTTTTHTLDDFGNYQLHDLGGFANKGAHQVIARFAATALLTASEATATLHVASAPGIAILVQGKRADGAADPAHELALNRLRKVLLARGITDADIQYLGYGSAAGLDALPSKANVEDAIRVWAKGRLLAAPAPLTIALAGYGEGELFTLDTESVSPLELATWLDNLEAALPSATLNDPRTVIIAANQAASFLPGLSAPGRIVVASTDAEGSAYQGPAESTEGPDVVRSASRFLNELSIALAEGRSMATAFNTAGAAMRYATRAGGDGEEAAESQQQAQLDDNGDGAGSAVIVDYGLDGELASESILGIGPPVIRLGIAEVTDTLTLADEQDSALLWTRLNDGTALDSPWVTIRAPSDRVAPAVTELQGTLPPLRVALPGFNPILQRWELNHAGFDEPGLYEIDYYVVDALDGSLSAAAHSLVYRDAPGNQPPGAFALLSPDDGVATSTAPAFSWTESVDPNGDAVSYTLEVAEEPTFSNPVHWQDQLSVTAATITAEDGLRDLTTYFWRVLAVDRWGAVRESETRQFTTDNSNGTPVLLRITTKDTDGQPLGSVDLTVVGKNAGGDQVTLFVQSTVTGLFSTQLGVGAVTVTPSKAGYIGEPQVFQLTESGAIVDVFLSPQPSVDLEVTLDYTPAWPRVDESIDYTVQITNRGPQTATGIIVASDLVGTDFTVTAAPGCLSTDLPLVCDVPDLAPAASMMLTISAIPNLASVSAQHVVNATANEEDVNPANNEGVILSMAVADADNDGDPDDTDPDPGTANAFMSLAEGLNLIALPVIPVGVNNASDVLNALGVDAIRIERLNGSSGSWEVFDRINGGTNFAIAPGEGYALTMQAPGEVNLVGDPVPRVVNLASGVTLMGVVVETGGSAYGLLTQLGGHTVVATIATFDPHSGRYLSAGFDGQGQKVGQDFPILRGRAYYIMLRNALNGFELR